MHRCASVPVTSKTGWIWLCHLPTPNLMAHSYIVFMNPKLMERNSTVMVGLGDWNPQNGTNIQKIKNGRTWEEGSSRTCEIHFN